MLIPETEWDPGKAQKNFLKHGVTFQEAVSALEDECAVTVEDDHPGERRFLTIGLGELGRILVVVFTYRGDKVRLISARKASLTECCFYEREK
jgi:uncharacterized protein